MIPRRVVTKTPPQKRFSGAPNKRSEKKKIGTISQKEAKKKTRPAAKGSQNHQGKKSVARINKKTPVMRKNIHLLYQQTRRTSKYTKIF